MEFNKSNTIKMKSQIRQSPNESYKARVKAVKRSLPKNVRDIIYERFPQYSKPDGVSLINNVLTGSSSDVALTEILEQISLRYKQEKQEEITNSQTLFKA